MGGVGVGDSFIWRVREAAGGRVSSPTDNYELLVRINGKTFAVFSGKKRDASDQGRAGRGGARRGGAAVSQHQFFPRYNC